MSRNIKEIGKELMGKSLNSFHRKTGLTQLEENNKMQDGILNGILSQVDDAYIEKTEQSNVIHLDGSGDGVVVVDGIEGNTMVNLWDISKTYPTGQTIKKENTIAITTSENRYSNFFISDKTMFKPNTDYTFIVDIKKNTLDGLIYITSYASSTDKDVFGTNFSINGQRTGVTKRKLTTLSSFEDIKYGVRSFFDNSSLSSNQEVELNIIILEGDWTNREIPASYFKGLQSSFEEKVNDEGKYEIEILSQNLNICDDIWEIGGFNWSTGENNNNEKDRVRTKNYFRVSDKKGLRCSASDGYTHIFFYDKNKNLISFSQNTYFNTIPQGSCYIRLLDMLTTSINKKVMLHQNNFEKVETYISNKQNKIKLLLDEPLRKVNNNYKDRLCIKDNELVVERNVFGKVFDGTEDLWLSKLTDSTINVGYGISATLTESSLTLHMCDRLPNVAHNQWDKPTIGTHCKKTSIFFNIPLNWLGGNTINDVKQYLVNQYNQGTPMKIVHILNKPIYEEVLNEYGEPILLEGYENGTLYIDSTIVPTTTVRYTPKMESFKTLNEVSDNNIMLTNDIDGNIIPYMMDVDLMIMEKEMALMSHKNIRTIGVKDMTSMQKRTQDMLERLIKGKTLTEQECKTRVVTYLNAGKITDEQAKELNFLIDEIYA